MSYVNQKGAAILTNVVLLLTLASCSSFYWLGISQLNLHIAMNTQNKTLVHESAASGLQHALSQLNKPSPTGYTNNISSVGHPLNYRASSQQHFNDTQPLYINLLLESLGVQGDSKVSASLSQHVSMIPLISQAPLAPLLVAGNITNLEGVTLVANPNGSGINVPLSIWTHTELDNQKPLPSTCHSYEFQQYHCANEYLSKGSQKGNDIADNPANFPKDILHYMTSIHLENWFWLKDEMDIFRKGCDNIEMLNSSKIWIEGDCTLSYRQHLGSKQKPILLIVQNGDLTIHQASKITGIVLMFNNDSYRQVTQVYGQKGAEIQGALISTLNTDFKNTHLDIVYDINVISTLIALPDMQKPTPILASWRDH